LNRGHWAKSGFRGMGGTPHVRATSGYATVPGHDPLAFSLLVNNETAPGPEVRLAIDRIALALIE